jgi:hypothetical protein
MDLWGMQHIEAGLMCLLTWRLRSLVDALDDGKSSTNYIDPTNYR